MKKLFSHKSLGFILGVVIAATVTVSAAGILASDVILQLPKQTTKTNVQDALNELYDLTNKCPVGYKCTANTLAEELTRKGNGTSTNFNSGDIHQIYNGYFVGTTPYNYVSFNGSTWRILNVNGNTVKLIYNIGSGSHDLYSKSNITFNSSASQLVKDYGVHISYDEAMDTYTRYETYSGSAWGRNVERWNDSNVNKVSFEGYSWLEDYGMIWTSTEPSFWGDYDGPEYEGWYNSKEALGSWSYLTSPSDIEPENYSNEIVIYATLKDNVYISSGNGTSASPYQLSSTPNTLN